MGNMSALLLPLECAEPFPWSCHRRSTVAPHCHCAIQIFDRCSFANGSELACYPITHFRWGLMGGREEGVRFCLHSMAHTCGPLGRWPTYLLLGFHLQDCSALLLLPRYPEPIKETFLIIVVRSPISANVGYFGYLLDGFICWSSFPCRNKNFDGKLPVRIGFGFFGRRCVCSVRFDGISELRKKLDPNGLKYTFELLSLEWQLAN